METGRFGIWVGRGIASDELPEAAKLAEDLGFGTFWLGGSPRLTTLAPVLAATGKITIATGIVNVWSYEPEVLAAEFTQVAGGPGGDRLLLGIGVGHPEATSAYQKPLAKMRSFFDGLAAAEHPVGRERLIAAALGPKMLQLAFERSLGTHPYFTTPEHTKFARELLGPDALIAPELAVVIDDDSARAQQAAQAYAAYYLRLQNYTANLRRFGFDEDDLAGSGSQRLLDAVVPCGSAAEIAEHVNAHLTAGADHVCVQTVGTEGIPTAEWTALAHALGL